MRKLLITGGAGFIGSNFVHYWKARYPNDVIVVLDKLTYAGNKENLTALNTHPNFYFIPGDINDCPLLNKIFLRFKIDTIVNFAAESHVDRSIHHPEVFLETNVMGTHSLLTVAKKYWLDEWKLDNHRFHHISTDEVFGTLTNEEEPFTEETPYRPNSPYAASKAAADHIVRAFNVTYGLKTTISNCSNNYGPYQFPEKLIPLSLVNILTGKAIPVYGDGQQIRDWMHVTDHCRAIEIILNQGKAGECYNIGGHDGEVTNFALLSNLCALVDELFTKTPTDSQFFPKAPPAQGKSSKTLITPAMDRPGHDRRYAIDSTKIQNELGFQFEIPLHQGLYQTATWYLENSSWWRPLVQSSQSRKSGTTRLAF